jgi:predicted flap endonuclease-1-like 5' DNA nuclease
MIEWATQYWYLCLIALVIGIATAAWIWLRVDGADAAPVREIDEQPAPMPLEPARPVIDVAEPVNFAAQPPAPDPVSAVETPTDGADRPAIAAAVGAPDDLTMIKGVGPKLNALLISLGVTRFDQIAAWGSNEIAEVDRFLGNFQGRIDRDAWIEQAGYLARGDTAGFTARFGELGTESRG